MKSLNHENIVRLYDHIVTAKQQLPDLWSTAVVETSRDSAQASVRPRP